MRRLAAVLVLMAAAACGEKPKETPQPVVEDRSVLIFPAGSPQLKSIVSVAVEPRRELVLGFNGRLVWNEERTARVFAPFAGRVLSIAVRPGDHVNRGQTLAVLAAPELGMAQAEARKAELDNVLAQKSFERVEELHQAGVAPTKDLQLAQAELARSAAERSRTQARLKLYGNADTVDQTLALRSPIAGVVVERSLNPGQEVRPDSQPDKPLFVVSDPNQLWFVLDVAEKDLAFVKPWTEVKIAATSLGTDRASGRVVHVADVVDAQTRTVKVRGAVVKPDARLKAEMYITTELRLPAPGGLLVPSRAVYLRGEQYYAFVDEGSGRFARRAIVPGPIANGHQVVLGGLSATDRVVVDGSLLLERLLASLDSTAP
jgi:cobalt-zinc-cadmium efflux system membrane fusion protein